MSITLVTGAAGFIGSHVTRMLVERGRRVRALNAPGYPTDNLSGLDIEIVEGDLLDAGSLRRALDDVDALYHPGSSFPSPEVRREARFRSRPPSLASCRGLGPGSGRKASSVSRASSARSTLTSVSVPEGEPHSS